MGMAARFDGLITAVETGVAGEGQRAEGRGGEDGGWDPEGAGVMCKC